MFVVVGLMLTGVLIGYLSRKRKLAWITRVITVLIWVLLFLLGIEVGQNENVINGLHTLGLEAAMITLFALAGSLLAARALWVRINKKEPTS